MFFKNLFSLLGSGVLLLTDSIGKFVSGIDGLEVRGFPGFTIARMAGECESNNGLTFALKQKKTAII